MSPTRNPTPEQIAQKRQRDRERGKWRTVYKAYERYCDLLGIPPRKQ